MKEYPDQEQTVSMDKMRVIIEKVLVENLPECGTNEWFIESVHFANMLDKIMQEIWMNV